MPKTNRQRQPRQTPASDRPRILVLEALTGSSRCVTRAGGIPITVNPRIGSKSALKAIATGEWDALLLTGGSDIDPRRYGAKPHRTVYGVNEVRDHVEALALAEARKRNVPVLGICRGHQMINVEAGGTLRQHIGSKHQMTWHPAYTAQDSTLARVAGSVFPVRSLHHQAVKRLGNDLRIVARAADKTPEAIESQDGRVLGVQFHPEMDSSADYARAIFRWLATEAASRAGLPEPTVPKPPRQRPKKSKKSKSKRYAQLPLVSDGHGWLDDAMARAEVRSLTARAEAAYGGYAGSYSTDLPTIRTPKRRPAGTRTYRGTSPVQTFWGCSGCTVRFDSREDRDDHVRMFGHGTV